jgi:hypothetical protein
MTDAYDTESRIRDVQEEDEDPMTVGLEMEPESSSAAQADRS